MNTIFSVLSDASLSKKSILERLVRHKCGLSKEELFAKPDRPISDEAYTWIIDAYHSYINEDQPLEYILGYVEFLGVRFFVTSDTLIPRPETEYMINAVNERLEQEGKSCSTLFDIGTGCGVLGLSVLWHNPGVLTDIYCTDISNEALRVATKNYDALFSQSQPQADAHVQFFTANILDDNRLKAGRGACHENNEPLLLVANLPYIPDGLFEDNTDRSVKKWEPKFAFVGGDDGLDWYRVLFDQMIALQATQPIACTQFLEMMTWQVEILRKEYGNHFAFTEVKTFHFNIRIVQVVWQ